MFDFGFWELALIGLIALLVVGPERLPTLARQLGEWIGKTKRYINIVRADIERELGAEELKRMLNEQQHEIEDLKGMISKTETEFKTQTDNLVKAVEDQAEDSAARPAEPTSDQPAGHEAPEAPHPNDTPSDDDAKRPPGS